MIAMNAFRSFRSAVGGFLFLFAATAALHAEGSPPLITDDPGTPGDGHWEINLGLSTERRPGERVSELPLIDVNYGIGDRWQLKYEVPYLRLSEDGESSISGLGNSEVGVKWRFYDAGEGGLSVSVYPQVEFNNPGSHADDKGLAEHGSAFILPFQFEKDVGPVTLIWQVGREFRSGGDSWFYGISAGHRFNEKVEVAVELAGGGTARLDRTQLTANFGVVVDLSERDSVMFSIGRELHNHAEPRASLVAYVGWQLRL
jgi:hypothetical protein